MTYCKPRESSLTAVDGLNQMLDWMGLGRPRESGSALVPAMDVSENDDSLTITMELPGLTKEELDVTLENGVLSISGEKKLERKTDKERYHSVERRTGSFRRSVSLPSDIDAEKADASFEHGVLRISVPKSEQVKPKRLSVK